jgi:hypothetical protein
MLHFTLCTGPSRCSWPLEEREPTGSVSTHHKIWWMLSPKMNSISINVIYISCQIFLSLGTAAWGNTQAYGTSQKIPNSLGNLKWNKGPLIFQYGDLVSFRHGPHFGVQQFRFNFAIFMGIMKGGKNNCNDWTPFPSFPSISKKQMTAPRFPPEWNYVAVCIQRSLTDGFTHTSHYSLCVPVALGQGRGGILVLFVPSEFNELQNGQQEY